jgi:MFS family permease
MWELYAFWAFVPLMLKAYVQAHPQSAVGSPVYAFLIIGIGSVACALAGLLAKRYGNKRTAAFALAMSGCCCLLSPLAISLHADTLFILFMLFWGITVVADSPLFSALVAQASAPEVRGTSLTLVTCIGFAITIASIQLLQLLSGSVDTRYLFVILAAGPAVGLMAMLTQKQKGPSGR